MSRIGVCAQEQQRRVPVDQFSHLTPAQEVQEEKKVEEEEKKVEEEKAPQPTPFPEEVYEAYMEACQDEKKQQDNLLFRTRSQDWGDVCGREVAEHAPDILHTIFCVISRLCFQKENAH